MIQSSTTETPTPDTQPEYIKRWNVRRGDIWELGRHRIMCGSSSNDQDVAALLAGVEPDTILTDPPYCSGGWQEAGKAAGSIGQKTKTLIKRDQLSTRGYCNLIRAAITDREIPNIYIFCDWRMWVYLFDLVESAGYGVRSMIVWDKQSMALGVGWRAQHEIIMFATQGGAAFDKHRGHGNVINCPRTRNVYHPTEKPLKLLTQLIDTSVWCRDIYDPFAGSGSTIITAEQTGRACWAMELDPGYVAAAIERFYQATGDWPQCINRP